MKEPLTLSAILNVSSLSKKIAALLLESVKSLNKNWLPLPWLSSISDDLIQNENVHLNWFVGDETLVLLKLSLLSPSNLHELSTS